VCRSVAADGGVRVSGGGALRPVELRTLPYPGFPTDLQAQMMALLAQANGHLGHHRNHFRNRFMHALELMRMGADIRDERFHRHSAWSVCAFKALLLWRPICVRAWDSFLAGLSAGESDRDRARLSFWIAATKRSTRSFPRSVRASNALKDSGIS